MITILTKSFQHGQVSQAWLARLRRVFRGDAGSLPRSGQVEDDTAGAFGSRQLQLIPEHV